MFQEQLDNIFVSLLASIHKCSSSTVISCIQLNLARMVQEEFDNIFVSISTCKHECRLSTIASCIHVNSFRMIQKQLDNISVSIITSNNKTRSFFPQPAPHLWYSVHFLQNCSIPEVVVQLLFLHFYMPHTFCLSTF